METTPPKEETKLRWGEPWNPASSSTGVGVINALMPFVGIPFWNIYLALNWRRLGKPRWMPVTLAAAIAGIAGFIVGLVGLIGIVSGGDKDATPIFLLMMMSGLFLTIWLWLVLLRLQYFAYQRWRATGSADVLYGYDYRVGRVLLQHVVGGI